MAEIELDLSLCTVAPRHTQALAGLLTTVYGTTESVGFEALVAEVEASGATALVDDFPGLLVVRHLGWSRLAALNHLLSLSQGRYVALLDPDVLVQPGCLDQLVAFMDDNPEYGLAAPRIINAYGRTESTCAPFPKLLSLAGLPLPTPRPQPRGESGEVDWCQGGFHLLRRELLDEIGPLVLDERCPGLFELDLYWRARRQGWHASYCHEAVAVHANPGRYHPELAKHRPLWPVQLQESVHFLKKRWLGRAMAIWFDNRGQ